MSAARRLAAIVAADVVGYSRLWVRTRRGRGNPTRLHSRSPGGVVRRHGLGLTQGRRECPLAVRAAKKSRAGANTVPTFR
jgi:hypothetical protein